MIGIPRCSQPLAILAFLATSPASAETNWPQFRGPGSKGVATGDGLPDRWSATENVAWKTDLPGRGWSSPIVWGNRVFLTTVVNSGTSEEPKKGLYFGGNRPTPPDSVHQWKVLCLDLETGHVVWERQVHEGQPQSAIHLKNSFASETPVTDGKHVYCYFGNIGIFCFDLDGNEVWRKKLEPHQTRFGWGTAASPVLHGDRLYVVNDNDEDSYLLALEKQTGREAWRDLPRRKEQLVHAVHLAKRAPHRDRDAGHRQGALLRSGRQSALVADRHVEHHDRDAVRAQGPALSQLRLCARRIQNRSTRFGRGRRAISRSPRTRRRTSGSSGARKRQGRTIPQH